MREMKDSGIEWIGDISSECQIVRLKHDAYMKGRIGWQGLKSQDFIENGPYCITSTDFQGGKVIWERCYHVSEQRYDMDPYIQVKIGDILISKDGTIGKLAIIDELPDKACLNSHLLIIRPSKRYTTKYLYYVLSSDIFTHYYSCVGSGSTMQSLSQEKMGEFSFPIWSIKQQNAIADYLDIKCSEIDDLTADIEKQIETLEAYKKSVITETLFENHNAYTQLKHIGDFQNGINFISKYAETEVPFLGVGDFQNNMVLSGRNAFSSIMYDGTVPSTALLKNNDIVFVRSNGSKSLVGRSVLIKSVDFPLTYSGFCIRFRNKRKEYDSKYIMYALWSDKFRETIDEFTRGTNITNVSQDMLKKVLVPERTLTEQIIIIHLLDQKCAEIDQAINLKRKQLDVLADYKKSLIYEYVTGKKEVF